MVPEMDPKVDPTTDPLWGAQVLRNTRNSKGFGAFRPLGGTQFWTHFRINSGLNFGTPEIRQFSEIFQKSEKLEGGLQAKWAFANPGNMYFGKFT